ncbi:MAG: hypothetical protein ACPGYT_06630 [Nitrospirales bacterium]
MNEESPKLKQAPILPQAPLISRRSLLKMGIGTVALLAMPDVSAATRCSSIITPRQTRGPYFPYDHVVSRPIRENPQKGLSLIEANDHDLTQIKGKAGKARGPIVYVQGQLLRHFSSNDATQENCQPLAGAVIFLWQANFSGRYNHYLDDKALSRFHHPKTGMMIERVHDDHFQYWGQAITDTNGEFLFKTILPGFYPATDDWFRPPHLHFSIRATGYPEFVTQTYFAGEALPDIALIQELNALDGILRDSRIQPEQQEQVIVEYRKDSQLKDGLVGSCQFVLPS